MAPSVVATDGTTVVKSISETFTPGLTWKGILFSSKKVYLALAY